MTKTFTALAQVSGTNLCLRAPPAFCRQRLRASVGAVRLSQHIKSLNLTLTNAEDRTSSVSENAAGSPKPLGQINSLLHSR
ncbi:MAG: gp58-like family protein [Alphaproteobacteria bacterium]|nr:gp58-like family protein [Alphaproteobacteria bacterium]